MAVFRRTPPGGSAIGECRPCAKVLEKVIELQEWLYGREVNVPGLTRSLLQTWICLFPIRAEISEIEFSYIPKSSNGGEMKPRNLVSAYGRAL